MKSLSGIAPIAFAALRIFAGLIFFYQGGQKLFSGHVSTHEPWMLILAIIEFAGGLLIMLGAFTRPAALVASVVTAFLYFRSHSLSGLFPPTDHGELALLYCLTLFLIACTGAGKFAVQKS
jgi:putative oxidoreductase